MKVVVLSSMRLAETLPTRITLVGSTLFSVGLMIVIVLFVGASALGLTFLSNNLPTAWSWYATGGVIIAGLVGLIALFNPIQTEWVLSSTEQTATLTRRYLIGIGPWLRERRWQAALRDMTRVQNKSAALTSNVEVATRQGDLLIFQFSANWNEAKQAADLILGLVQRVQSADIPASVTVLDEQLAASLAAPMGIADQSATAPITATVTNVSTSLDTYSAMLREIRSWAFLSITLGVIRVITLGGQGIIWSIILIVVGLASFYFRDAAMLIVYAVILAWLGLMNVFSGGGPSLMFGGVQAFLAFRLTQRFFVYHQAQLAQTTPVVPDGLENKKGLVATPLPSSPASEFAATPSRTAQLFPWAGGALGGLSFLGTAGLLGILFLTIVAPQVGVLPGFFNQIEGLIVYLGVLAVALGLASLLSGFRYKIAAIVGLVAGALTLGVEVGFILLARLN